MQLLLLLSLHLEKYFHRPRENIMFLSRSPSLHHLTINPGLSALPLLLLTPAKQFRK